MRRFTNRRFSERRVYSFRWKPGCSSSSLSPSLPRAIVERKSRIGGVGSDQSSRYAPPTCQRFLPAECRAPRRRAVNAAAILFSFFSCSPISIPRFDSDGVVAGIAISAMLRDFLRIRKNQNHRILGDLFNARSREGGISGGSARKKREHTG